MLPHLLTPQLAMFGAFSLVLLVSALMVISSRNPVHSVLFLILTFFNGAGLFVLAGAELLAMTLLIVYVGAVAVLFLFVVMMFDKHLGPLSQTIRPYKTFGLCLGGVLLIEMVWLYLHWQPSPLAHDLLSAPLQSTSPSNAHAIGNILYTNYAYLFQLSGLILLVAIVGAITLTLQDRETSLRQQVARQVNRNPDETVTLHDVKSGEGVQW